MSLFRREEHRAIRDLPWGDGLGNPSPLTPDRALRLAPVYAAANLLAGSIAGLPLQVYRDSGSSKAKLPLPSLFQKPAARGTRHDWLYKAVVALALHGNAVGMITTRDGFGFPTTIEWLPHGWANVEDSNISGPGSFTDPIWRVLGRPVPTDSIVHIPWFVFPGRIWGLSPISAYATSVNTALAAQDYKADWFKAGGVPPGTFKNQRQTVEQADARTMKARLVEAIRSHEPLVYGADWEYSPITVPAVDAEFVDTMRLTATQIAVIYGIPPTMIGGETGGSLTYATVEQNSINFVQFGLLPWFTRFEAAFDQLLPARQYVKFNADAMIRTDIQTRYNVYQLARSIGAMNRDEIREREDEAPLPGGQGKDYTPLDLQYAEVAHATRTPSANRQPKGPTANPGDGPDIWPRRRRNPPDGEVMDEDLQDLLAKLSPEQRDELCDMAEQMIAEGSYPS